MIQISFNLTPDSCDHSVPKLKLVFSDNVLAGLVTYCQDSVTARYFMW